MILTPKSAYIHVPFCHKRCGYCNFTLVAGREDLIDKYLQALELELSTLKNPTPMQTLFIGGGTPTLLPSAAMQQLLDLLKHWLPLELEGEWTIEGNPDDITTALAKQLVEAGVNRISLGGQSFHADKLRQLDRDHTSEQLHKALTISREHFSNVSLDLIFGAPADRVLNDQFANGESLDVWQNDLQQAIDHQVNHVSTYGLTIEKGTSFWNRVEKGELRSLGEDTELAMYQQSINTLTSAGFEHYEVSNFARPGYRSRHNEVYWTGLDYFAFGPGAARFLDSTRSVNHRSTTTYLKRLLAGESPIAESETLTAEQRVREHFVFGMRRLGGVDLEELNQKYVVDTHVFIGDSLEKQIQLGNFDRTGSRVKLTKQGLFVSDSIWPDFL